MVEDKSEVFNGNISDTQFGYMTGRSTEVEEVVRIVDNRYEKFCYGIFLNMSGAFGRVWWQEIVSKLHNRGVTGQCLRAMQDYLRGR